MKPYYETDNGKLYHGECLEVMQGLIDAEIKVDMILCDLPYGTTRNQWDSVIDFTKLWNCYKKIIKPDGCIVLTAQPPFDKVLATSNLEMFKYEWIWEKEIGTGHLNAKKMPLKSHENILIFYSEPPIYNPQYEKGKPYKTVSGKSSTNYGNQQRTATENNGVRYPKDVLYFLTEKGLHPTQKPVAMFEYLIKTYTNENQLVLDNCSGSGTTAKAAEQSNRKWICIEKEKQYCDVTVKRLQNIQTSLF